MRRPEHHRIPAVVGPKNNCAKKEHLSSQGPGLSLSCSLDPRLLHHLIFSVKAVVEEVLAKALSVVKAATFRERGVVRCHKAWNSDGAWHSCLIRGLGMGRFPFSWISDSVLRGSCPGDVVTSGTL